MKEAKTINKCCLDTKNHITIIDGWSYLCKKCGRYTFDYSTNQHILSRKETADKISFRQKQK